MQFNAYLDELDGTSSSEIVHEMAYIQPMRLTDNEDDAYYPDSTLDSRDNLHVTWFEDVDEEGAGTLFYKKIFAADQSSADDPNLEDMTLVEDLQVSLETSADGEDSSNRKG